MEQTDSLVWGFGIGLFFLGIAVGIALSRFNDKYWRQTQSLEREMHNLSNDYHAYRAQVTDHFIGSAKLLNKLTEDYRNIYHHLAVSSEHLVGAHITDVLEFKKTVIVDDLIQQAKDEQAAKAKAAEDVVIPQTETKVDMVEVSKEAKTDIVIEKTVEQEPTENAKNSTKTISKKSPEINLAKEGAEKKTVVRKKTTRRAPTQKTATEPSMEDSQSLVRTLELVKEQVQEKVEEEKVKAKRGRPRKAAAASDTTAVRKATKRPKKSEVELEDLSNEKIA